MELGVFQASFSTSSCSVSRHDVLTDRFVLNEALIYQRLLPRCPKSSLYVEGGCKSLASRFKSYWAPSDQFKSLHKSGATVCHRENAEHKLQVQKKSWIERNISSSELRWALHDAEATNFMKIPSSARPAHGLESRWISLTENTRRRQVKGMVARCNHQSTLSGFTDLKDQLKVLATRPKINRELFPLRLCEVDYTRTTSNNLGLPEFSQYKGKINDGRTRAVALEAAVESNDSALPLNEVKPYAIGGGTRERPSKKSGTGASTVSSGVRLEHISKTFKGATVLKDVNWEVKKGEKVGLVGVNGAGKTTQLKIIAGDEEPDSGSVIKVKENMKISFLTQEFEVVLSRTVKEEFLSAFSEQMEILDRIEMIHKALESAGDNMTIMGKLLDELDGLQKQVEEVDLNSVDAKINKMMPELGFSQDDNERLVASFSGGWQMRMSLGKIFLQDPDLLLLDEPTNHLDLDTIEWLENYLKKQDVPMVIVSHDRAFLDRLCTKIVETDMGVSCTFEGNYSNYVQAKAAWVEAQRMAWEKQQKEISRTKDIIQRLSGGANAGRASTAEKQLEKIQEEELVEKPFEQKQIKFRFPEMERSGRTVVIVKNMDLECEDKVLFKNANLLVERGEKLAIIGPNGCGKSTLLRMIMGFEEPTSGEVYLGEHRVITNYFEQNQAEALDLEKSVMQTVEEAAEDWNMNDLRGLLGRCNFKGDMVLRKVALLSGGEKARLALCKFMVTPSTLLVLDEPTNHLDIPSKEMLEEAIRAYKGTVIAVSHDRYFLKQIVNRVVEVKDNILQDYAGDYNYYLEQNLEARRRELEREAELEAKATTIKAKSKMSKAEKELQKKQKAQTFQQNKAKGKIVKNAKRWN